MNDLVKMPPQKPTPEPDFRQRQLELASPEQTAPFWNVLTGRYQTWKAVRQADEAVQVIDAQTRLAEANQRLVRAQLAVQRDTHVLRLQVEEETRDGAFWKNLRTIPDEYRMLYLERERDTENLLATRERIRQSRLTGSLSSHAPPPPQTSMSAASLTDGGPIQPYMAPDSIDQIATKAVMKLGHLSGPAAQDAWDAFSQAVYSRFPVNIAVEIETRIQALRQIGGAK